MVVSTSMKSVILCVVILVDISVAFQPQTPIRRLYDALLATPIHIEKCFSRKQQEKLSATQLSYRDDSQSHHHQQASVDDYLEFLDRRYHRLYDEQVERKFPTFKWLIQNNGKSDDQQPIPTAADNALYALGVAGLASKELLQKYQISIVREQQQQQQQQLDRDAVDAQNEEDNASSKERIQAKLGSLFRPITASRRRLLHFQSAKARAAASTVVRTLISSPRFLWKHSGGKATVGATLSLVSALVLVVARPLASAIVTEGANHA